MAVDTLTTQARPHRHAFYESGARDVVECDCGAVAFVGPDGAVRDANAHPAPVTPAARDSS